MDTFSHSSSFAEATGIIDGEIVSVTFTRKSNYGGSSLQSSSTPKKKMVDTEPETDNEVKIRL